MNKVILTGRFTKNVELKKSEGGKDYINFTVAIKKNKDEAEFIDVTAFDNNAVFISKYGKKGDVLNLEAHLQNRVYEKDGTKQYRISVIADSVELFSNNKLSDTTD